MGNANSKFLIPSILAGIALCVTCVCCAGVGLYLYGDRLVAGIRNPVSNNPPTEITATPLPDNTSGLPEWTVIVYSAADDEVLERQCGLI